VIIYGKSIHRVFAAVPRVIEKLYDKIILKGKI